jgi:hypothetical protein
MSWVRTSDDAPDHPKLIGLTDAAYALWHRALSYCNRQLTDGFVPAGAVPALSRSAKPGDAAKDLVTARLWEIAEGGFMVHDYLDYQPSRAEVEEERRKKSEAKQRAGSAGGKRSGESRKQTRSRKEADAKQEGSRREAGPQAQGKQNEAPDPVSQGENPPGPPSAAAPAADPGSDPEPVQPTDTPQTLADIWPKDPEPGSGERKPTIPELEAMARHAMARPAELTPYERSRVAKVHARLVSTLPLSPEDMALIVEVDTKLALRDDAQGGPAPSSLPPLVLSPVTTPRWDPFTNAGPKRDRSKLPKLPMPTTPEDE